ncbi:MAG: endonuclease [Flavobacteriaceae bacterium]|nr:MAG: endonuclease [Flavobacteriaceae bacterium]
MNSYYVYILTNSTKKVLYLGVTNNLSRRISEHYDDSKNSKKTFAGKYNCVYLIFYEKFTDIKEAIAREKEIKKWRREKKENLINGFNPNWDFISVL